MEGNRQKNRLFAIFILALFYIAGPRAQAGQLELGGTIAYGKSNLGQGASSRTNRYTAELAWRFTRVSAIELSYMRGRTKFSQTVQLDSIVMSSINQSVTMDDYVISASWVQNFVPADFIIQPYFKIGGGRMVRKQRVVYSAIWTPQEVNQKTETGVLGLGLRIFLTKRMALKGEFVSYMPRFHLSEWQDSQLFSAGLQWIF